MDNLTKEELDDIRNNLPRGYGSVLRIRLKDGYCVGYIYQVMRGERKSRDITDEAALYLDELRKKKQRRTRRIKKIINDIKKTK